MTKQQRIKSVAIAKDALKSIRVLKITPGTYVEFDSDKIRKYLPEDPSGKELQPFLPKIKKNCVVCALGACFLSHVGLFNKLKLDTFDNDSLGFSGGEITETLRSSLGVKNMTLIESAFECTSMGDYYYLPKFKGVEPNEQPEMEAAIQFGSKYDNPRMRLRKIMANLIANDGEFIPPPIKKDE